MPDNRLSIVSLIEDTQNSDSQKNQRLKIAIMVFFLLLGFYLAYNLYQGQVEQRQSNFTNDNSKAEAVVLGTKTQEESQERFPVQVIIPAINVNANVQQVGITSDGDVDVPSNTTDIGWFKFGPRPGENGSAVVVGHLNGENGEGGVFADLSKLKPGDKLYIKDGKGSLTTFVVRETRIYDPGHADDVFKQSDDAHLNLITCDGVWDEAEKSYSKRLVVFSDIER